MGHLFCTWVTEAQAFFYEIPVDEWGCEDFPAIVAFAGESGVFAHIVLRFKAHLLQFLFFLWGGISAFILWLEPFFGDYSHSGCGVGAGVGAGMG